MKVLITGGAGFIGSNLAEAAVKAGYDVVVLDNFFLGREENLRRVRQDVELVRGDIMDEALIRKITKDTDFILHHAAASSSGMFVEQLKSSVSVNIQGTINLMEAARDNGVRRFIYASTSSIYGNNKPPLREDMFVLPPNFYSATKLEKEYLAMLFSQEYGLETVGFRYMSVYGPNEESKGIYANLVSQFLWTVQKGEQPVIYGDGSQTRDFTYVKDVVQANMLAMESRKKMLGEIFNVGSDKSNTLNELVDTLNRALGTSIEAKHISMPVKTYIYSQVADISKIKSVLGYRPAYDLEKGIRDMLAK